MYKYISYCDTVEVTRLLEIHPGAVITIGIFFDDYTDAAIDVPLAPVAIVATVAAGIGHDLYAVASLRHAPAGLVPVTSAGSNGDRLGVLIPHGLARPFASAGIVFDLDVYRTADQVTDVLAGFVVGAVVGRTRIAAHHDGPIDIVTAHVAAGVGAPARTGTHLDERW